ncbi:MAG: methyltransferase domain-containing protein [Planctomycetes bacterium]|nr:methyltransferase domain-containing protein [Planctomycetota bacterium]
MKAEHVSLLVCPRTKRPLELKQPCVMEGARVREGALVEPVSGARYPIVGFIPRFVPQENYARSFGFEWNAHARTQYDEVSGFAVSRERFEKETQWGSDLRGQTVLEVGSGSGRFTRHALATGAIVVSFDYSSAVEANYRSNGAHENLLLVQASVFDMPFRPGTFDKAFCFGVLQHTPDPRRAFMAIVEQLKPGGAIASDVYPKDIKHCLLSPKYLVRLFTRRRDPERLYRGVRRYVDFMWPLARLLRRIPRIGPSLNWGLLVADYSRELPGAPDATLKEWAYLDTFDILSPRYDKPQTLRTFRSWHREAGLVDIDVRRGYNGIEGRGRKPGGDSGLQIGA